mgnify:FL=1
MQTQTITLSDSNAPLNGKIHAEHILLSKKATELTINNIGPRIVTLMGNSRKRVAVIITPGDDMMISEDDIDRMEIAIREPMLHTDVLFGAKGTIPLFQATKQRASEII